MKRSVFVVIFILFALGFMYAPGVKVVAQSQQCFSSQEGFVPSSQNPGNAEADFVYESVHTKDWKFKIYSSSADIVIKKIDSSGNLFEQPVFTTEVSGSTADCKYLTFDFQRDAASSTFDIPLTSESVDDGVKRCVYSPLVAIQIINALGGKPITELSQICPDLQQGRTVDEGEDCPQTAECAINIPPGEKKKYGFGLKRDSCGNLVVVPDNGGEPILESDIEEKAQNFMNSCGVQEAGAVRSASSGGIPNCVTYSTQPVRCPWDSTQNAYECIYQGANLPWQVSGWNYRCSIAQQGHYYIRTSYNGQYYSGGIPSSVSICNQPGYNVASCFCTNGNDIENSCLPPLPPPPPAPPPQCGITGNAVFWREKIEGCGAPPVGGCRINANPRTPCDEWKEVTSGSRIPIKPIEFKIDTYVNLNRRYSDNEVLEISPIVSPYVATAVDEIISFNQNYPGAVKVSLKVISDLQCDNGMSDSYTNFIDAQFCKDDGNGNLNCNNCGNSFFEPGEQCDTYPNGDITFRGLGDRLTCKQFNSDYISGNLRCTNCQIDVSECRTEACPEYTRNTASQLYNDITQFVNQLSADISNRRFLCEPDLPLFNDPLSRINVVDSARKAQLVSQLQAKRNQWASVLAALEAQIRQSNQAYYGTNSLQPENAVISDNCMVSSQIDLARAYALLGYFDKYIASINNIGDYNHNNEFFIKSSNQYIYLLNHYDGLNNENKKKMSSGLTERAALSDKVNDQLYLIKLALDLDPNNANAKNLKNQVQRGVIKTIEKRLEEDLVRLQSYYVDTASNTFERNGLSLSDPIGNALVQVEAGNNRLVYAYTFAQTAFEYQAVKTLSNYLEANPQANLDFFLDDGININDQTVSIIDPVSNDPGFDERAFRVLIDYFYPEEMQCSIHNGLIDFVGDRRNSPVMFLQDIAAIEDEDGSTPLLGPMRGVYGTDLMYSMTDPRRMDRKALLRVAALNTDITKLRAMSLDPANHLQDYFDYEFGGYNWNDQTFQRWYQDYTPYTRFGWSVYLSLLGPSVTGEVCKALGVGNLVAELGLGNTMALEGLTQTQMQLVAQSLPPPWNTVLETASYFVGVPGGSAVRKGLMENSLVVTEDSLRLGLQNRGLSASTTGRVLADVNFHASPESIVQDINQKLVQNGAGDVQLTRQEFVNVLASSTKSAREQAIYQSIHRGLQDIPANQLSLSDLQTLSGYSHGSVVSVDGVTVNFARRFSNPEATIIGNKRPEFANALGISRELDSNGNPVIKNGVAQWSDTGVAHAWGRHGSLDSDITVDPVSHGSSEDFLSLEDLISTSEKTFEDPLAYYNSYRGSNTNVAYLRKIDDQNLALAVRRSGTGTTQFVSAYKFTATPLEDSKSILKEIKIAASKNSFSTWMNAPTIGQSTRNIVQIGTGERTFYIVIDKNARTITAFDGVADVTGLIRSTDSSTQISNNLFSGVSDVTPDFCGITLSP